MRKSNFEILRILCMLSIIMMHWVDIIFNENSMNGYWAKVIVFAFGNLGVNTFMLISGYFGIKFKRKKIIELYAYVWITSIIELLFKLILGMDVSKAYIIQSLFPITTLKYWFMSAYFIIYFLSFYLEKLIESITSKEFKKMIALFVLFFSIVPTLLPFNSSFTNNYAWLVIIYLVGAYIRKYDIKIPEELLFVFGILTTIILTFAWTHFYSHDLSNVFYKSNSFNIFVTSLSLFLIFRKINILLTPVNYISRYIVIAYLVDKNIREIIALNTIIKVVNIVGNNQLLGVGMSFGIGISMIILSCIVGYALQPFLRVITKAFQKIEK